MLANSANSSEPSPSVAAVVVTFNRLALLQECVGALRAQTRAVEEIIVIDNSSTDGTADWLAAQTDLHVVTQHNTGSSGGQHTGAKVAYLRGHNWIWLMDDDTIPDRDALESMTSTTYFAKPETGFLCSMALWTDRTPHPMHAMFATPAADWCGTVLADGCIRVTMNTFVSVLVSRTALAAVGLPVKEFFLMVDDYEFTERVSLRFASYCVLKSRVVHKAQRGGGEPDLWGKDLSKACYLVRNELAWTLRRKNLGVWGRAVHIINMWAFYCRIVLRRKAHPRILWWLLRGFFFRYRIEFV